MLEAHKRQQELREVRITEQSFQSVDMLGKETFREISMERTRVVTCPWLHVSVSVTVASGLKR